MDIKERCSSLINIFIRTIILAIVIFLYSQIVITFNTNDFAYATDSCGKYELKLCKKDQLCLIATSVYDGKIVWNGSYDAKEYISEAKKRGYDCDVGNSPNVPNYDKISEASSGIQFILDYSRDNEELLRFSTEFKKKLKNNWNKILLLDLEKDYKVNLRVRIDPLNSRIYPTDIAIIKKLDHFPKVAVIRQARNAVIKSGDLTSYIKRPKQCIIVFDPKEELDLNCK